MVTDGDHRGGMLTYWLPRFLSDWVLEKHIMDNMEGNGGSDGELTDIIVEIKDKTLFWSAFPRRGVVYK